MKTYIEAETTFTAYCNVCDWHYESYKFKETELKRQEHESIDH